MRTKGRVLWVALAFGLIAGVLFWLLETRGLEDGGRETVAGEAEREGVEEIGEIFSGNAVVVDSVSRAEGSGDRWDEVEVISDAPIKWDFSGKRGHRARLVEVPGIAGAVRLEEELERESLAGEVKVGRRIGMAAGHVLVKLQAGLEAAARDSILSEAEAADFERVGRSEVYLVRLRESEVESLPAALAHFKDRRLNPFVEYAEPDYVVFASDFSDDPFLTDGLLWGLHNEGAENGVDDVDIDAIEGWDIATDASEVVVAVIDTGLLYTHKDLAGNVWVNTNEIAGNGIDDDGNGYVDDIHGINSVLGSGDPLDDHGHGTHVAGTIGAVGNNGEGISGVAWRTQLMALKFLSASGSGLISDATECLDYAVEAGARVVNNSWGGGGFSTTFQEALERAAEAGTLCVAAAGNDGSDNDENPQYPASFDNENVIAVGSIGRDGEVSVFSNFGLNDVDIFAPGEEIYSTWFAADRPYRTLNGTSMATPHVSGILALQLARFPDDDFLLQRERLLSSAVVVDAYLPLASSGALANLGNALAADDVRGRPIIVKRPKRVEYAVDGAALAIEVEVRSETPEVYRWFFEEELLEGEALSALRFESVRTYHAGDYRVEIENAEGVRSTVFRLEVVSPRAGLSEAVDAAGISLYAKDDGDWSVYPFDGVLGGTSIRSESVRDGRWATLFTELRGPGVLEFSWRISSERNSDFGSVRLDGEVMDSIDGETDWEDVVMPLGEDRVYVIEWRYEKDGNAMEGDDSLYLDRLVLTADAAAKPRVLAQPRDYVAGPGTTAMFEVSAVGGVLVYQWFKDGIPIPGGDERVLALSAVSESDAGFYSVEISNENGVVSSGRARLEVAWEAVEILQGPEGGIFRLGNAAAFSVVATGTEPLGYQWFRDGVALEGETGSSLNLTDLAEEDAGVYSVVVSNTLSPEGVISEPALLEIDRIQISPRFIKHPRATVVADGGSVSFHAVAEGLKPIDYQWYKGGRRLQGETESTLRIGVAALSDEALYSVTAENVFGRDRSEKANLVVVEGIGEALDQLGWEWRLEGAFYFLPQTEFSRDRVDALRSILGTPRGSSGKLATTVEGPGNVSFDWMQRYQFGSRERMAFYVDGEKRAVLSGGRGEWIREAIEVGAGAHELEWRLVSDGSGSTGLFLDQVAFSRSPVILKPLEPQLGRIGGTATFAVESAGGELDYQWFRNGQAIEGATGSALELRNIGYRDGGAYRVQVTNAEGFAASSEHFLQLEQTPNAFAAASPLTLATGGSPDWSPLWLEETRWALGFEGARAGENWLETVVEGPAFVRWQSVDWGGCTFGFDTEVDGVGVSSQQGNSENSRVRFVEIPAGSHVLRWSVFIFCLGFGGGTGNAAIWDIERVENPIIRTQPRSQNRNEESAALLVCEGIGLGGVTYQWFHDGAAVEGATEGEWWLRGLEESDEGAYACLVEDAAGRRTWSESARVEVRPHLGRALDENALVAFEYGDQRFWASEEGDAFEGGDALVFTGVGGGRVETLDFWFRKAAFYQGSLQRFFVKTQLGAGDRVRIWEGERLLYEGADSANWFPVPIETEEVRDFRIRVEITRAGNTVVETKVSLDRFELNQAPEVEVISRSVERFGEAVELSASYSASGDVEVEWSREGALLGGSSGNLGGEARLRLENFSAAEEGLYTLTVRNDLGVRVESSYLQDSSRFGWALDSPNTRIETGGPFRWSEDLAVKKKGTSALRGDLPEEGGRAFLQFDLSPERECVFWIRATGGESASEIRVFLNGELEQALLSPLAWTRFDMLNVSEEEEALVRIELEWEAGSGGDQFWIDGLRMRRSSSFNYAVWAFEAFDFEQRKNLLLSGPEADPDGDGLVNRMEYAFEGDPFFPDELPTFEMIDFGGGWFGLYFDLATERERPDVEYWLEKSFDLADWTLLPKGTEYKFERDGVWNARLVDFVNGSRLDSEFNRVNVNFVPEDRP